MRYHDESMIDATEFGVRFQERHMSMAVMAHDGGGGSRPKPTQTRTVEVDGRKKTVPVTPKDVAKEAIKDGKITDKEKAAFEKHPAARAAARDEQGRLKEKVQAAEGADHLRDRDGKLVLNRDGKAVENFSYYDNMPTEHEQRVAQLARDKDRQGLDALDKEIKAVEDSGSTVGLQSLKQLRAERAAEEAKIAAVIEDKESLIGTYELEKAELKEGVSADAENDYQKLRAEAAPLIEQFNANGGQYYEGNDWFGDDWDESEVDFDRLANRFYEKPELLDDFARVQGKRDGDGGDTAESMEAHIADVARKDPELARKISLRYAAAVELQGIMERYNAARSDADGNAERIQQIDAEISILKDSIDEDKTALSTETLQRLEQNNEAIDGIIEPQETPTPTGTESTGGQDEGTEGTSGTEGSGGTEGTEGANGESGTEGTEGTGETTTETAPSTQEVKIDYNTPERRAEVLAKAQEASYLPAHDTTFNEQGQAVYTVQPGDSYWRISDMSDGKPPHEFDTQHFLTTLNSNSERLGRDPQVGLIHPNEQIVIANRSIDDLVILLNLPTVETVEAPAEPEEAPHAQGGGGGGNRMLVQ